MLGLIWLFSVEKLIIFRIIGIGVELIGMVLFIGIFLFNKLKLLLFNIVNCLFGSNDKFFILFLVV